MARNTSSEREKPFSSSDESNPGRAVGVGTGRETSVEATAAATQPHDLFDRIVDKYEQMTSGVTRRVARLLVTPDHPAIPDITSRSVVHDNACGTGIVTQEIMSLFADVRSAPEITATDTSVEMMQCLDAMCERNGWSDKVTTRVAPAESLEFLPGNTFTHSFTNFGMLFFADAPRAAGHVYRILRPGSSSFPAVDITDNHGGGCAVVTTWHDPGYFEAWESAQAALRPGEPLLKLPVSESWKDPEYLEQVMREAGFTDVTVYKQETERREESVAEMGENIALSFSAGTKDWLDHQRRDLPGVLMEFLLKDTEHCSVDGETGECRVVMVANVAICWK